MHDATTRTELLIAGMRGNECRERIAAALGALAGVTEVAVNLYRARAVVVHGPPCRAATLIRAVQRAGYSAAACAEGPPQAGATRS